MSYLEGFRDPEMWVWYIKNRLFGLCIWHHDSVIKFSGSHIFPWFTVPLENLVRWAKDERYLVVYGCVFIAALYYRKGLWWGAVKLLTAVPNLIEKCREKYGPETEFWDWV